jgi:hypothetical protein
LSDLQDHQEFRCCAQAYASCHRSSSGKAFATGILLKEFKTNEFQENDNIVCLFCDKDFGPLDDRYPMYAGFQHVLFECTAKNYCMLCLGSDTPMRMLDGKHVDHWNEKHNAVYNR